MSVFCVSDAFLPRGSPSHSLATATIDCSTKSRSASSASTRRCKIRTPRSSSLSSMLPFSADASSRSPGSRRRISKRTLNKSDLKSSTPLGKPSALPSESCLAPQKVLTFRELMLRRNDSSGILVPGGFGLRGTEGMIAAAKWAREKKIPYLGICLGFQIAVIEFARNVLSLEGQSMQHGEIRISD